MIISDQSILLSLTIGVIIGMIFSINKAIIVVFGVKKIIAFLLDFTFAVISCVLTFLGALSISFAYLRLLQVLLELIAAISFYYAFSEFMISILHFFAKKYLSLHKTFCSISQKIRLKFSNMLKNVKKTTKNQEKT